MRNVAYLKGLVCLALVAVACSEPYSLDASDTDRLSVLPSIKIVDATLADHSVPGIAIATISDYKPGPSLLRGKADVEQSSDVTGTTVFEMASLSKPVFAYLIMTLVDRHEIDLDEPLGPDFDYPRIEDKEKLARLSPRIILANRSGLPNWVGNTANFARLDPIAFIAEPDEQFTYSGEGFQVLKTYVERKTGQSLQQIFERELGAVMPHSTWVAPLPPGTAAARGYRSLEPLDSRSINLDQETYAAGSLVGPASDYARFLSHACAREGLSEASYAQMLGPVSVISEADSSGPDAAEQKISYALGWGIQKTAGAIRLFHPGDNAQFHALAILDPASREGIVYLTNAVSGAAVIEALEASAGR